MSDLKVKSGKVTRSEGVKHGIIFYLDIEGAEIRYPCYLLHSDQAIQRMGQERCGNLLHGCGVWMIQDTDELNGMEFMCWVRPDGKVSSFVPKEMTWPYPPKRDNVFKRIWRAMKESW